MKLFVLNDQVIHEILHSLTIDDDILNLIEKIVHQFDNSFSSFVYNIFSAYTTYYISLTDSNCHLDYKDIQNIYSKFTKKNINIDQNSVFIADIYDILYMNSSYEKTCFNHYFYEDIYNKTEILLGASKAISYIEDLFDALEILFTEIECNFISHFINISESSTFCNIVIYFELGYQKLMIYVL